MSVPRPNIRVRSPRRGIAIAAVLLTGLGLLLVVLGLLHSVRAGVSSIGGTEDAIQIRLAARSAVRGFATILARDRDAMLSGRSPDPPASFELFELPGGDPGRLAVVRLIPVGPSGGLLAAEGGRLDLNSVDATALQATGLFSAREADVVIAARDARPGRRFDHVSDLLALEGDGALGPTRVLGPLDEIAILSRVDEEPESAGERIRMRLDADLGSAIRPIADVFTVHSFEPDLDAEGRPRLRPGIDDSASEFVGRDETRDLVERVLAGNPMGGGTEDPDEGEDESDESTARSEDDSDPLPTSSEALVSAVRRASSGLPAGDVGTAFDRLTIHDGGWRNGLLDINTASIEALQGIPGIDSTLAAAIVARRDSVEDQRRFDRFWPVVEEIVTPEVWDEIVPRITTRSLLWRAILAVGSVPGDELDGPLQSPLAWEVLVDCGSPIPRIVELRDVTLLELTAHLMEAAGEAESALSSDPSLEDDPSAESSSRGLFDDAPLFDGAPLFDDPPLFDGDPLFNDADLFQASPLFDPTAPGGVPGDGFEDPEGAGNPDLPSAPRDRGPGGRWRSSGSSR